MLYHLCHSYFQSCFLMPKGAQFLKPVKRKIFLTIYLWQPKLCTKWNKHADFWQICNFLTDHDCGQTLINDLLPCICKCCSSCFGSWLSQLSTIIMAILISFPFLSCCKLSQTFWNNCLVFTFVEEECIKK